MEHIGTEMLVPDLPSVPSDSRFSWTVHPMVLDLSCIPAGVLIVEDEMVLPMFAVDMVEDAGYILCPGLVIRTFDPHIHVYPHQPSRLVGTRGDFQRKGSACSNLGSIARKQPSAANWSRVRAALRKAVNFKTWRTASSRWRITSEASRTLITMPCTLWRRTGLAARPLPPKKSTFCGVLGRRSSCNGTPYRRRCHGRSSIPPGPWARCWRQTRSADRSD